MLNVFIVVLGKAVVLISKILNLGNGSTWPGHIALSINKNFIKDLLRNSKVKIILVAGTNGKTTTGKLIKTILKKSNKKVFQNEGGANLLNGIASTLVLRSDVVGRLKFDFAIFEIDENTLPLILKEINNPDYIIILNLFRDQLDRYGEVNTIAKKWGDAIRHLLPKTTLILNADDPQVASLGSSQIGKAIPIPYRKRSYASVVYFGLNDKSLANTKIQHAADSTYCPNCSSKLLYSVIFYSHLGIWECPNCKNVRPKLDAEDAPSFPLAGIYNRYNTIAAVLLARQIKINESIINSALHEFKPAFGRQEILNINGKKVQIFLSKNPTSLNESLRTVISLDAKTVLFVLNDRIPDGRDVSWIWDIELEEYINNFQNITVSGDRCYDMGLRIKYTMRTQNSNVKSQNYNSKFKIIENLDDAIKKSLTLISSNETLYILPTYSAMLEVRKILTGKKIL